MNDVITVFFKKFDSDKRPFAEKLKLSSLARATYADLRHNRRVPKKKTIEGLRAYLEDRKPKYDLVRKDIEFYCCSCETIKPLSDQTKHDRWQCNKCSNLDKMRSQKRHWDRYLRTKRACRLRKRYGSLSQCIRTIIDIKKELRKYAKN